MEFITNNIAYLVLAVAMATASGVLGSFAIMRKMALASDPISHIALPGLGVAIIMGINPVLGAGVALLIGAIIVWGLEKRTGISAEVMIGVIFSLALAIGAIIAVEEHLIDELLGNYKAIGNGELIVGFIAAIGITLFLMLKRNELTLTILSPELAKTSGLNIDKINFYFLIVFVLTILLGLKYMGVLLMGSLIIIPAAVGKQLATSFMSMIGISVVTSVISAVVGILISAKMGWESGPSIIIVAAIIFFLSLFVKRAD